MLKSYKKIPVWGFFYLRVAQNSDHTHAIIDQPKIQLASRTACMSGLPLPFCLAIHAGASIIDINNNTHAAYFANNKISFISIIFFA